MSLDWNLDTMTSISFSVEYLINLKVDFIHGDKYGPNFFLLFQTFTYSKKYGWFCILYIQYVCQIPEDYSYMYLCLGIGCLFYMSPFVVVPCFFLSV